LTAHFRGAHLLSFLILSLAVLSPPSTRAQTKINPSQMDFGNVLWAGPGALPTIDTQIAACGSNPCTIYISALYTGPDSVNLTTNAVDDSVYNIYRGSNIITIHDLRGSTNKAYGVNYGGVTLGSQARLAVTQAIVSPSTTTSAILGTNQISGNVTAAGGALAAITGEVDIVGPITGIPANIVQASNGQWGVRSTGQTLPLVVGVQGGGGIDRNAGAGGTNITTAEGVEGDGASTILGTGTITNNFGVRGVQSNVGTLNNFALVSEGNTMFKDNGCIYGENGSSAALKLLCFGIDSAGTGGANLWSFNAGAVGAVFKFMDVPGTHFNWMIASQQNVNNAFEITPSTAVGGTTFSTPEVVINAPGASPAVQIKQSNVSGTGLLVSPGADTLNALILSNTANTTNGFQFDGLGHELVAESVAPGASPAAEAYLWFDATAHAPKENSNASTSHFILVGERGSCTMTAASTCTFSVSSAFTSTPLTFASIDAASVVPATANSAKCSISGTTVTITAGISNSLTWDCLLVGSPN
jgi:hypothetical protein